MTHRERVDAILHYQKYDRMPVVHFGYWGETLKKWADEGHITQEEARSWGDGNVTDAHLDKKLGWDFDWSSNFGPNHHLSPGFESKVIRTLPDGSRHVMNWEGTIELDVPGAVSIRAEIEHTLKDRASWEEHYKHRYQWTPERVTQSWVRCNEEYLRWNQGGKEFLKADKRDYPMGLFVGSLYGNFRNIIGVEGSSYLYMDDEPLYREIIGTIADICYRNTEHVLNEVGGVFDNAHMWEDICFKNGPLVAPSIFDEIVGPHYKRITDLLLKHGIDIVSLDCDGCIDALIPTWLKNGVNTMFPIEVGTWNASIAPWREKYGKDLRGVGGMNKVVFGRDRKAMDQEIERLRRLVDLGGFIPCPDHRLAPDAKWDLVRYYCDEMHRIYG
jgi:hypothetical protein